MREFFFFFFFFVFFVFFFFSSSSCVKSLCWKTNYFTKLFYIMNADVTISVKE